MSFLDELFGKVFGNSFEIEYIPAKRDTEEFNKNFIKSIKNYNDRTVIIISINGLKGVCVIGLMVASVVFFSHIPLQY